MKASKNDKMKGNSPLASILKRPAEGSLSKYDKPSKKKLYSLVEEMDDVSENDVALFEEPQRSQRRQKQTTNLQERQILEEKRRLELEEIKQEKKEKSRGLSQKMDKKRKSVAINEDLNVNIQYDPDKKWDTVIENEKKGPFSQEEEQILYKSICNYALQNDMTVQEIQEQIFYNVNPNKKKGMWTTICSVLPRRSINSCFKFVKRKLDPKNYKGHWSAEEVEELKAAIQEHNRKWSTIAKVLNRTPQNIRDKYRSLGEEKSDERVIPFWKMSQLIYFLKAVEKEIEVKFLNREYRNKITDLELHDNYEMKERQGINGRGGRKRISQNFLFHNLSVLINFINFAKLEKADTSGIGWSKVSQAVGTKSKDDCRNKWKQMNNIILSKRDHYTEEEDRKLIQALQEQDPENQFQANFDVDNNHSAASNKARWNVLKKFVSGRIAKSMKEVIKEIKSKNFKSISTLPDTQEMKILKMFMEMKKVKESAERS